MSVDMREQSATEEWLERQLIRGMGDLAQSLRALLTDPYFSGCIAQFLSNADAFARLSARSYRHCNGFDRIDLAGLTTPELGLRLHVWHGEEGAPRERIHGHPWNFASTVLIGSLEWEAYGEQADGQKVEVWQYARPDGGRSYRLTRAGTTGVKLLIKGSFSAGTVYIAGHELLHRVWSPRGVQTATLMVHTAGIAYPSRVFAELGDVSVSDEQARQGLTNDVLRADLEILRTALT